MAAKTQIEKTRTKAPTVPKQKYEMAVRAARASSARARETAQERIGTAVGMGTAYVVGKVEKNGKKLPSFGGIEGTALWGAALAFGPSLLGGGRTKLAQIAAESGSALLGIACYKAGKGITPLVAGEGDWE